MVYVESAVRSRQIIAAARAVLVRDGVGGMTIRAVAQEAGIPLGTLQYVFPTKQQLLRAVIEDVVEDITELLKSSSNVDAGLENAIKQGVWSVWNNFVVADVPMQLVQYELTVHALRTAGLEDLARWQYERYVDVVTEWLEESARRAGEVSAIDYRRLARLLVAGVDGLILQFVVHPDFHRGQEDVKGLIAMIIAHARVRPAAGA
ncbi:TetR/AcrR family transcriptional regulator [Mycolicibacterium sp.]|uniref:TetR/AcrR family transcriptional regulator n=1 Tax=Mycolicibacterium sp. TaxID=2320850 RepID=UPI0028B0CC45|nr:TetR/AcrR family transcriptional regulator [Mycolicibacterium sp.]